MDVAQEAHFSNKDTWDSCQDGKQIKDVSKQSAKAPQCGVFFFVLSASMRFTPPGLARKNAPGVFVACLHGRHPSRYIEVIALAR
ncbi:hypothetical protein [Pseudomonas anguilliseptica]|uniref:hypothetical protein n=1 Tax=Pseudomonas anguilliseptica TaxID=53406 RepID=UPI0022B0588E|nr:hypothetical protein [Pseudomonas anguilliseptica]MCZ4322935.1 hypothetical protein [Pseudomonas anguilliseptica]